MKQLAIKNKISTNLNLGKFMPENNYKKSNLQKISQLIFSTFQNFSEGILITDKKGNIEFVNPAFTSITGYNIDEIIGKNPRILKSGHHDDVFYRSMWDSLLTKGKWQNVFYDRHKNGDINPCWLNINTIKDSKDNITNYLGFISKIDLKSHINQSYNQLTYHDPVGGMTNRILFLENLQKLMSKAFNDKTILAVMSIGLSNLKTVINTLGSSFGNLLLNKIIERLRLSLRDSDLITHVKEDEIIIVTPGIKHQEDVIHVAQKIVDVLSIVFLVDELKLFVDAHVGISLYPYHSNNPEILLKNANNAMHHISDQESNSYQFYTDTIHTLSHSRLTLESSLHKALENNDFKLRYQPQINLKTGDIVGLEALLYWYSEEDSRVIPPDEFIPLAEEIGLIVPIGDWVIKTACFQNKCWQDSGYPHVSIAINFSPRQFGQKDLIKSIDKIIEESKLDTKYLEFEITESIFISDITSITKALYDIKERGIKISIDDFGKGYSSLNYLKRFPIEKLKIDKSFIQDIVTHPDDAAIVRAIISMGNSLNIKVVAEGVETKEQLDFLIKNKCDKAQGYYFSPPLLAEDISILFNKGGFGKFC
ncbi:MAG: EAL domain-containing protein [Spirochaetota bacterium]|nr:EAL domain-containing protein [Spirochaetota bacterium]